jgi:Lrp/AsnC family transcriptional regulator, leucine-responsive regulatory protein
VEAIDRQILAVLLADGRRSFTEIAEKVGLSVSAVHQRVKRLEQRGAIQSYTAKLNYGEVGLSLTAFVAIRPMDPGMADDAPEKLRHLPQIESCYSVAGEDNYLLLIRVANPVELERLISEIRAAAHVVTRTTVVLSTPYEGRPIQLLTEEDD